MGAFAEKCTAKLQAIMLGHDELDCPTTNFLLNHEVYTTSSRLVY